MKRIVYLCPLHTRFDTRILDRTCVSLTALGKVFLVVRHPREEIIEGVRIVPFPTYSNRFLRMTLGNLQLLRTALRLRGDVYITISPESLLVAWILKTFTRASVVNEVHEHFWGVVPYRSYMPAWVGHALLKVYEGIRKFVFPRLDGLIAAFPSIAEEVASLNRNTVTICNYPILEDHPEPHPSEPAVCYIGTITPDRAIENLIIAAGIADVKFHLAGPFDSPEYEQKLRSTPGWERVVYHGVVDRITGLQLMADSSAGLIVIAYTPNHARSFANKIFEYMGAGLPVIASDFPLWRRIVEESGCGIVVDPSSPEAIAAGIRDILDHPERAREMRERGKTMYLEHYNWSSEETKLREMFRRLLKRSIRR
jgi:glycosyltransferase involved in cell wall biosynthesis